MGRRGRQRQRDVRAVLAFVEDAGSSQLVAPDLVRLVRRRTEAEAAVGVEVRKLREAGASWTLIGQALGVTRQAARQRYGEREEGARQAL